MAPLALILSLLAADDLTPAKAAQVQHDRDKAMADIDKKYGNKQPSELSQDERREMIRDQREAEDKVLEKHGVNAKDMARYEARMNLGERDAAKAELKKIEKKEEDDKKAAAEKANQPQEIQVQRGFSDSNPVVLEEKAQGNGPPVVEKGLPPDAIDDQNAASGGSYDDSAAPAAKSKSGGGKSKK
jgi:hypothetical protein